MKDTNYFWIAVNQVFSTAAFYVITVCQSLVLLFVIPLLMVFSEDQSYHTYFKHYASVSLSVSGADFLLTAFFSKTGMILTLAMTVNSLFPFFTVWLVSYLSRYQQAQAQAQERQELYDEVNILIHHSEGPIDSTQSLLHTRARLRETTLADLTNSEQRRRDNPCCICLEPWNVRDLLTVLPCQHIFHQACIETWFKNPNALARCPLCQTRVQADQLQFYIVEEFSVLNLA